VSTWEATQAQIRIEAERRRRASRAAAQRTALARFRFDPAGYITEHFGWTPWRGSPERPGQMEVLEAYRLALRQQHERRDFEAGRLTLPELQWWRPGQTIQNWLHVESGHGIGKTKVSSGIVNHFFDCFTPSIIYSFAPSWEQIHDLLWKEIKADRRNTGLPGRINDLELKVADNHFAKGRATNNAGGSGTERVQGQHGEYLLFVLDEAEGIADFVYDAVKAMTTGGIAIVLMLANPRTRTSRFAKAKRLANVQTFRISCMQHPNVLEGREVVPGAVQRQYVLDMIDEHAEVVAAHSHDHHTFELPWAPGTIYQPDVEFQFRVLGIAPGNLADNTMVPVGRFEAARARAAHGLRPHVARMGVDAARFGKDYGTLYVDHAGRVRRAAQFYHQNTLAYFQTVKDEAKALAAAGVTSLHVRVDGTGGFGAGLIDLLRADSELATLVPDLRVYEVHFGGAAVDGAAYFDTVTELYGEAAKALTHVRLESPPAELEGDLCERTYTWRAPRSQQGTVKKLEGKDEFKKRVGRSPDDGDGCVLALAPDHLFTPKQLAATAPAQVFSADSLFA
jgi:hypothetical protein